MKSYSNVMLGALVAAIAFAPAAHAVLLAPGAATGVLPSEGEPGAGAALLDSLASPFVTAHYSGTLLTSVYSDPGNALGGLTFTYELFNAAGSMHSLGRLTVNGYGGFAADVSAEPNGPSDVLSLGADRGGLGDVIGFNWATLATGPFLAPGSDSRLLVIETDAPWYVSTTAAVINGSAVNVATFSPDIRAGVPDGGATVLLLGLGFGALGIVSAIHSRRPAGRS